MYTGKESKAGTDANVSMQLFGQRGDTGLRRLLSSKTNSDKFEQGQVSCDLERIQERSQRLYHVEAHHK